MPNNIETSKSIPTFLVLKNKSIISAVIMKAIPTLPSDVMNFKMGVNLPLVECNIPFSHFPIL